MRRIYNINTFILVWLYTCVCVYARGFEGYRVVSETPNSVTIQVSKSPSLESHTVDISNFNAKTQSVMVDGEYPTLLPGDGKNIFTEKHGIYSCYVGKDGIKKIIINMVGLYQADCNPTKRYVGFRLNKFLNVEAKEEALRFPKYGGEVELEFLIDNAGLSLYIEGDFTNFGRDYDFVSDGEFVGLRSYTDDQAEGIYSVKYKIKIPPARVLTTKEVFSCHWNCSYGTCFYGTFNLVVVQDGSSPEEQGRVVYIG